MTWSILARDPSSGLYGLAVASRFFAVGALCPWSGGAPGAAMSQALPNPALGALPLMLLGQGHRAGAGVEVLAGMEQGTQHRQLRLLDRDGGPARAPAAARADGGGRRPGAELPAQVGAVACLQQDDFALCTSVLHPENQEAGLADDLHASQAEACGQVF